MPRFSLARIWTPRLYSRIARHYDRLAWLIAPQSHEAQRRMLADLEGEMRRMAGYLEIEVPEQCWPRIVEACTFEGMKKKAKDYAPNGGVAWKGGADTFMNKGTNGRWKDVLTDQELAQYHVACRNTLTPECRAWLEFGRCAVGFST